MPLIFPGLSCQIPRLPGTALAFPSSLACGARLPPLFPSQPGRPSSPSPWTPPTPEPPAPLALAIAIFFFFAASLVYPAGGCDVRDAQQQKITTSPSATCWPLSRALFIYLFREAWGSAVGAGGPVARGTGVAAGGPGVRGALGCVRRRGARQEAGGAGWGPRPGAARAPASAGAGRALGS